MIKRIGVSIFFLLTTTCFAGDMGTDLNSKSPMGGFFLGLGGSYNLVNVNQYSWGKGISNFYQGATLDSTGVAEGTGAPFHATTSTLSPEIQAGYIKNFAGSNNLYGVKFSYQYLGLTSTNSNLYIPQLGQLTNYSPPSTSSLFGYVNADSVQENTSHEFTFLAFLGRAFDNKYIYLGAGPSLFNMKSHNYYSIGYAEFKGASVDVTGLVSYSSPTIWAWGGAAQIGMTYFINPTWFVDASYTYALSSQHTVSHEQAFAHSFAVGGVTYTTSGPLFTRDTMRVNAQAITLSINKLFNL